MNNWKAWTYRWLFINVFIFAVFFLIASLILEEFRESYTDDEILSEYDDILLGSAVIDNSLIKFKVIEKKKPKVIAIGSSRVMQFRSNYFLNRDFYTMGGTAGSIIDARKTFEKIEEYYTPEVIILGVDLWWLNPNFPHVSYWKSLNELRESRYKKLFQLVGFMTNDKEMRDMIFHSENINKVDAVGGRKAIGLSAAVKAEGYRLSDGSYQYGKILTNDFKTTEELFQDTHKRLENRNRRFESAGDIDYGEFEKLKVLISDMKASGCHVVVFLPPFPNEIYSIMSAEDEWRFLLGNFQRSVKKYCAEEKIRFFDFSNVLWVGSDDDECLDGFHGSEVTYTKIIKSMLEDKVFAKYIDEPYLDYILEHPVNRFQSVPLNE